MLPAVLLASLVALAGAFAGCSSDASPPAPADPTAPGTQKMNRLLLARAAAINPLRLLYAANDRRAEALARELDRPHSAGERLSLRFQHLSELLNCGKVTESLAELQEVRTEVEQSMPPSVLPQMRFDLLLQEAVAWLRLAEDQNCCARNTPESCLLPIRGAGVHERRDGSTRALQALLQALEIKPDNLRARWLLNLAHMTLGTYPDGVPARYLIPPRVFASEHQIPRFPNVASSIGLDIFGMAGGAVLEDLDGDGSLDLVTTSIGFGDQMRCFFGTGKGGFLDATREAGLLGELGGLNIVQADHDNDGDADLVVLRGGWMGPDGCFPLSLLRNNGNRTFTDVTEEAGMLRFAPTQTATWLDYDGDGWIDLFVGNESTPGDAHPCHLFRNQGNGHFTDVAAAVGLDFVGYVKAAVSGDYDNDGRPDLYLSVLEADNVLFHNDGPRPEASGSGSWKFTNVAAAAGVLEPRESFSCCFFDYDNDGWIDLFVVGYGATMAEGTAADYLGLPTPAERCRLFHNERGRFRDVTRDLGLFRVVSGMGFNFGDLDNDGFLDLYLGTGNPHLSTLVPNRMFRNAGGKVFQDVTTAGGFGHLQKGHAICFADVDNDGDQDIFAQMGGAFLADTAHSALFENPGSTNAWVKLSLQGTRSNRSAIGARIKVVGVTPQGEVTFHRVLGSGASFGANPLRQEIGLGATTRISRLEIAWPGSGRTDTFEGLEVRRTYRILEGAPRALEVPTTGFKLGRT